MAEYVSKSVSHSTLRKIGGAGHFMIFDNLYWKQIARELFNL